MRGYRTYAPFDLVTNLEALHGASEADLAYLNAERLWTSGGLGEQARSKQVLPIDGWARALALAGRGFGKTKMGANWVRRQGGLYPGVIIHVIAPTYSDLRGVLFEGPSGLRACIPAACIKSLTYSPYPEMVLWNDTIIRGFSSESPDRLRGPQATFVWGDELASWYRAEECLSNIDFSTRIAYRTADGRTIQPQKFYTTTPRPLAWLAEMVKTRTKVIRGSTYENRANLADEFFKELVQYEGTQLGKQELHGELLDISEAAIIRKSWLKIWSNADTMPWLEYVIVSLDTAFTEKTFDKKSFEADPTACTIWGVFKHNRRWNLILLECWEEWLGMPDLIARCRREMKAVYGRRTTPLFQPMVGKQYHQEQVKRADLLVIEDKGSGISLRQMLSNEGIDSYPYNPGNADKTARLHAVSHIAHAGRIWMPESTKVPGEPRNWADGMLKQLCIYSGPGTTPHDDFVDSAAQAWRVFADKFVSGGVDQLIKDPSESANPQPIHPEDGPRDYVYEEDSGHVNVVPRESPYG